AATIAAANTVRRIAVPPRVKESSVGTPIVPDLAADGKGLAKTRPSGRSSRYAEVGEEAPEVGLWPEGVPIGVRSQGRAGKGVFEVPVIGGRPEQADGPSRVFRGPLLAGRRGQGGVGGGRGGGRGEHPGATDLGPPARAGLQGQRVGIQGGLLVLRGP